MTNPRRILAIAAPAAVGATIASVMLFGGSWGSHPTAAQNAPATRIVQRVDVATSDPTAAPTDAPAAVLATPAPIVLATAAPTTAPTAVPTARPTSAPTAVPTAAPVSQPTANPTSAPTADPDNSLPQKSCYAPDGNGGAKIVAQVGNDDPCPAGSRSY